MNLSSIKKLHRDFTATEISEKLNIPKHDVFNACKKMKIKCKKARNYSGGRPVGARDKKPRKRRSGKTKIQGGAPETDDLDFLEKIRANIAETDKHIIDCGYGKFIKPIV